MKKVKTITLGLLLLGVCSFSPINEQENVQGSILPKTTPAAFVIGQHPVIFEALNEKYATLLLTACGDDMDKAFYTWKSLLQEIGIFAMRNDVDLNGVKMWLKVFWSADGKIDHIAYDLKPESRNINRKEVTSLLEKFVLADEISLDLGTHNFSHYGSVAFPIHALPLQAK